MNNDGSISRSDGKPLRFSCNIEIVNCLSVPDSRFEAMFSYEMFSTDLALKYSNANKTLE
ncbi:unnamed protein product, partial [Allacma fusca]